MEKKIKHALISVYYKDGLEPLVRLLSAQCVQLISTGGTLEHIKKLGCDATSVEELTGYPSIFGGRVKTLHPAIFGGILQRRDHPKDREEAAAYGITGIDLVVVDLYPFRETLAKGGTPEGIIEKIDIGGVSLLRAAAKNFAETLVVSSPEQYTDAIKLLAQKNGTVGMADRRRYAMQAFQITAQYDAAIAEYFSGGASSHAEQKKNLPKTVLRYGENPHQKGVFYGNLTDLFHQHNGKELSYNNLVDVDAALHLLDEFKGEVAFTIIKHTNACGVAVGPTVAEAYARALQSDPISAFGGVLACNRPIDMSAAQKINALFFEILIAPGFDAEALALLKTKKKCILLQQIGSLSDNLQYKSLLNGVIEQDVDTHTDSPADLRIVTDKTPTESEQRDLLFASKICKHTKSNAIVLAKGGQLLASGVGQTSRVDALRQAVQKAGQMGFSLQGAVMASDAFFPFADCVEIAHRYGISAVLQPGGSVKDNESIRYCNEHEMSMVFTGIRHFKH